MHVGVGMALASCAYTKKKYICGALFLSYEFPLTHFSYRVGKNKKAR